MIVPVPVHCFSITPFRAVTILMRMKKPYRANSPMLIANSSLKSL